MSGGHADWDAEVKRPLKGTYEIPYDSPNAADLERVDPTAPVPVDDLRDILDRATRRLGGIEP